MLAEAVGTLDMLTMKIVRITTLKSHFEQALDTIETAMHDSVKWLVPFTTLLQNLPTIKVSSNQLTTSFMPSCMQKHKQNF